MKSQHLVLTVSIIALVFSITVLTIKTSRREEGPWYLGCIDSVTGEEYLVKLAAEPTFKNGLIFIADKAFITPRPGMVCAVSPVEDAPQFEVETAPAVVEDTKMSL
jgi:hypothetical protein